MKRGDYVIRKSKLEDPEEVKMEWIGFILGFHDGDELVIQLHDEIIIEDDPEDWEIAPYEDISYLLDVFLIHKHSRGFSLSYQNMRFASVELRKEEENG